MKNIRAGIVMHFIEFVLNTCQVWRTSLSLSLFVLSLLPSPSSLPLSPLSFPHFSPSPTSLPPSPPSLPHLLTQGFMETSGEHSSSYPPTLIIILSRLVHDMERSTISYLVRLLILVSFPDYMGENEVAWE